MAGRKNGRASRWGCVSALPGAGPRAPQKASGRSEAPEAASGTVMSWASWIVNQAADTAEQTVFFLSSCQLPSQPLA